MPGGLRQAAVRGAAWVMLERFSVQIVQFAVMLVLARLLTPADYGIVGLLAIFLAIAGSLANCGFGNALVQKKEVGELEFNSVFYLSLAAAGAMYLALFLAAPWIADFYDVPQLRPITRIAALQIVFSAANSVQSASLSRRMLFHLRFRVTLVSNVVSASVGILLAALGFGVWALVWSSFAGGLVGVFAWWTVVAWRPRLMFSFRAVKPLFTFGWRMAASGLVHNIYTNLYGFLVGKVYTPADLAFVSKGRTIPNMLMQTLDSAVLNVSFPALSRVQTEPEKIREGMRRMILASSYVVFPALAGLAACARPTTLLLFGDQWLPAVPYVVIACFTFSLFPVNAINTSAIAARGRSGVYLALEIVKKGTGLLVMALTIRQGVFFFMLASAIVMSPFSVLVNMAVNGKLLGYTARMQIRDLAPSALLAGAMFCVVRPAVEGLSLLFAGLPSAAGNALVLLLAVPLGAAVYAWLSLRFRPRAFLESVELLLPLVRRKLPRFAGWCERTAKPEAGTERNPDVTYGTGG